MKEKVLISWSGGKDCAMALYETIKTGKYEVSALLTTITEDYDRISMHGVRRVLLERQADSLGFPLEKVLLPGKGSSRDYEAAISEVLERYAAAGVSKVVFGDIFLEDVRAYREDRMEGTGMKALFPLWGRNTRELAHNFLDEGFRSVVTCVDTLALDGDMAGRAIDEHFLKELPPEVDPCGENGEYHSFVYEGPVFHKRISFERGEVVLRDNRFSFCDLIPAG